jgi:putative oxidoreductase
MNPHGPNVNTRPFPKSIPFANAQCSVKHHDVSKNPVTNAPFQGMKRHSVRTNSAASPMIKRILAPLDDGDLFGPSGFVNANSPAAILAFGAILWECNARSYNAARGSVKDCPMTTSTKPSSSFVSRYQAFSIAVSSWQSLPLLLLRLYFGYQCAQAGIRHLETYSVTVTRFAYWRIPFPNVSVAIAGTVEIVGGFMLYLGLFSRHVALALMLDFLITMLAVNLSAAGFSFSGLLQNVLADQDYILKDNSFPYLMAAAAVFFFGPGWVSVDGLFRFWIQRKAEMQPTSNL